MKTMAAILAVPMLILATTVAVSAADDVKGHIPASTVEGEDGCPPAAVELINSYVYVDGLRGSVCTTTDENIDFDQEIPPIQYIRADNSCLEEVAGEDISRSYIHEAIFEPKPCRVRDGVDTVIGGGTSERIAENSAGFYYAKSDDVCSDEFASNIIDHPIEDDNNLSLTYNTETKIHDVCCEDWKQDYLGPKKNKSEFFAYIKNDDSGVLYGRSDNRGNLLDKHLKSSVLVNWQEGRNDKKPLSDPPELKEDYNLSCRVDPNNKDIIIVTLTYKGEVRDEKPVKLSEDRTYVYLSEVESGETTGMVIIAIHFKTEDGMVYFDGAWQISENTVSLR